MASATSVANQNTALSAEGEGLRLAPSKKGVKYRPDIDGLRAVAVLSVLAFHIGLTRSQGGFVGVDVFFVISGYLISSIIFAEINASHFTILGFYERRIRRIFPALFAMLAAFTVAAVVYLLPDELINYAKSMLAATCSASNIFFWQHSGYFQAPTSQPLLHTWSLAVEEQFYLSFPLFLLLVRRLFPGRLRAAVAVLFFASLITSCVVVRRSQGTAFYMPYARAWELLLGTLLSLRILPALSSVVLRNLATLGGIGMILWAVLFYSSSTVFPGLSALLPCVGAALIIWAGEAGGSLVGSVLSWRPVVFVGLISYSLYLWHWPIIVLRKMGLLTVFGGRAFEGHWAFLSPHRLDMVVEIVLSFILAVLSWRFVERPFRGGALRLSGWPLFALAGGVSAALLAGCASMILAHGFPNRFPGNALQVASALDPQQEFRSMRVGTCFITTDYHFENYDPGTCLRETTERKNYLLLGDSHSAMLWSALASELPNANVMQASTAACVPSLAPSGDDDCRAMMADIFQRFLPTHHIDGVFLVARWEQRDLDSLTKLIQWTNRQRVPVIVFGPVPEYDMPLPRILAYSIAWNEPNLASQHFMANQQILDAEMQRMAATSWRVPYVSLYKVICGTGGCLEYADPAHKLPLMGDDNHLSTPGAFYVVQRLLMKGDLH